MKIRIGEYDVLDSGTIITTEGAPVIFDFEPLKITFKFRTDVEADGRQEMKVNRTVISKTEAELEFLNFDAPFGCGNSAPYILGTFQGKQLSFLVRVSNLERGGKTISYTWLLKEENNG